MDKTYDLEELREVFPKILETQPEVAFFDKKNLTECFYNILEKYKNFINRICFVSKWE
jgi:hypothetical protein